MKRLILVAWLALIGAALACKVPVFRYALERWEADPYRALVLYRSAAGKTGVGTHVTRLREGNANLEVTVLDLGALTEDQLWQYDGLDDVGDEARVRLYYPHSTGVEAPFWEGDLHSDRVEEVLDSPVRQHVVEAILEGSSTTWVVLESGDETRDAAFAARLRAFLDQAMTTLEIPEGVVRAEEFSAEGATVEMDDVLRTDIPLKIAFPIVRLARDDPREAVFVSMLERFGGEMSDAPMAIPVFGRGRALQGIGEDALTASAIAGACAYLCGECSCQVKDQNPGIDLLLSVDWGKALEGSVVMVERALPALSGFGVPVDAPFTETVVEARGGVIPKVLGWTLLGLLVCVLGGTYLIARRPSR